MSGFSENAKELARTDLVIPEYFDINDVRKPPKVYVEDKLKEIISDLFQARRSIEKNLSRNELTAYDHVLQKYLDQEIIMKKLKREIYKDYNEMEQMRQEILHREDAEVSLEK